MFIAQMLVGLNKQLKQITQIEHKILHLTYLFFTSFVKRLIHKQQAEGHTKDWLHSIDTLLPALPCPVPNHGRDILVVGIPVFLRHDFDKVVDHRPHNVVDNNHRVSNKTRQTK